MATGERQQVFSRSHGVMVSTLDSESSDLSSNLSGTSSFSSLRAFLSMHTPPQPCCWVTSLMHSHRPQGFPQHAYSFSPCLLSLPQSPAHFLPEVDGKCSFHLNLRCYSALGDTAGRVLCASLRGSMNSKDLTELPSTWELQLRPD